MKSERKYGEEIIGGIVNVTKNVAEATGVMAEKSRAMVVNSIDENGNGEIDIEDLIIKGFKTPGVKINRGQFLKAELSKNYSKTVIEEAIAFNPAHANISPKEIDKIATEVIKYERNFVSGISAALGAPGGYAMVATIPADIIQYYGYMLRATQKLLYLYGFPDLNIEEKEQVLDSETMNIMILCLGVMYGSATANNAIKVISKALATGVEKKLLNAALTKGTIYPIVKQVATWFGKKMTKDIFAGFFKKSIPLVGGVIGGGITYFSFEKSCRLLKDSLQDTMLSNPAHDTSDVDSIFEF
ncbi:MAG: hypothetical protein A2Y20_04115 [Firmicutes bacterium GWF2_51_9]|nr:MAG: hypothetical protein A2Y20_04115 [Firmicutes bacterium GWF2_51_9]OGS59614.1 MAG: hypothetical protein A2Y19_01695 [Firmicutes bacterium GWE2_51_13]HBZ41622.1 hypothetical protein [Erysipelotrichaceae bacterium]